MVVALPPPVVPCVAMRLLYAPTATAWAAAPRMPEVWPCCTLRFAASLTEKKAMLNRKMAAMVRSN